MSSVIASNIPSDVSPVKVREFFSFCGKITDLKPLDDNGKVKKYEVVFASPKAVSTALLLSDAELENTFIKVEEVPEITEGETGLAPEQGGAAAAAAATTTTTTEKDIKEEPVLTGDKTYDEVDQEENQNTLFLHNCWQMDMLFPIKLLPRVLNLTRKMVFHLDSMNLLLDWIRNMSTRKILIVKSTNNCRKPKPVMKKWY